MEIKLIIRASNQNIEDQIIACSTGWTVLELKNHLSNVYPNRPVVQEQKLIYSGHILHDHQQLKEIIRQEDIESNIQILHLVWNGTSHSGSSDQVSSSSQDWQNQSISTQSPQSGIENTVAPENILRHRTSLESQQNISSTQYQQPPVNYLPFYPSDPQTLTQMAVMQQMYAQYFSQYWQSMNIAGLPGNTPFVSGFPSGQPPTNIANTVSYEPVQQPVNQRNNAPAVQIEENDVVHRDWLDHLFLYFRFLIMLCVVYFYTTPERFMLVILFVVVAFLYHEGWFVRQGIAEAVMGQRNRGEPIQNPVANANEPLPPNENEGQDAHELEATMDGEDPPHAQNTDAANNNNQVFSPLTFLVAFFSSLIPETPPPVNIN